jgi:hypothetical protein
LIFSGDILQFIKKPGGTTLLEEHLTFLTQKSEATSKPSKRVDNFFYALWVGTKRVD